MVIHEQSLGARHTVVAADVVCPKVRPSKGSFHALTLRDVILVRCEPFTQIFLVLCPIFVLPVSEVLHIGKLVLAEGSVRARFLFNDVVALDHAVFSHIDIADFVPNRLYSVDGTAHLTLHLSLVGLN